MMQKGHIIFASHWLAIAEMGTLSAVKVQLRAQRTDHAGWRSAPVSTLHSWASRGAS